MFGASQRSSKQQTTVATCVLKWSVCFYANIQYLYIHKQKTENTGKMFKSCPIETIQDF